MKKNFTPVYALQQVMLWGLYGCLFSYANPYLTEQLGISDGLAGLILGVATALSFLLQPLLTSLADTSGLDAKRICILGAGVNGLSCVVVLLLPNVAASFFALACVSLQILPSFSNALGMQAMRNGYTVNFAVARGIGSVSFGVFAKLMALVIEKWGNQSIALAGAVVAFFMLLTALPFPRVLREDTVEERPTPMVSFFRQNPRLLIMILASVMLYVGHNAMCNCMFRIAQSKLSPDAVDGATALQGSALMIAAVAELPTMFLFTALLKKARCDIWLCLSCAFMTLKILLTLVLPGETALLLTQLTQMGGYALYAVASVYYVGTVVAKKDVVKGQTYLGASNTLGCVFAYVVGGVLIDAWGTEAMLMTCLILSVIGMILMFCARQRVEKTVGT
ncbi:MAG: MFS transporter [Oscillospiraceae bacterium]|nr:MFS transporter [Oscillospiraceae bacterium]